MMMLYKDADDYEVISVIEEDEDFYDIRQGDYIRYGNLYYKVLFKLEKDESKFIIVNHPITIYDYR